MPRLALTRRAVVAGSAAAAAVTGLGPVAGAMAGPAVLKTHPSEPLLSAFEDGVTCATRLIAFADDCYHRRKRGDPAQPFLAAIPALEQDAQNTRQRLLHAWEKTGAINTNLYGTSARMVHWLSVYPGVLRAIAKGDPVPAKAFDPDQPPNAAAVRDMFFHSGFYVESAVLKRDMAAIDKAGRGCRVVMA